MAELTMYWNYCICRVCRQTFRAKDLVITAEKDFLCPCCEVTFDSFTMMSPENGNLIAEGRLIADSDSAEVVA